MRCSWPPRPNRRRLACLFDAGVVQAQYGGHGALWVLDCYLHGLSPFDHQRHGVAEAKRTRGGERAVLAEAVSGMACGIDAESFDCVEDHHAGHEGCQLGVTCLTKFASISVQERWLTSRPAAWEASSTSSQEGWLNPWCTHAGFLGSLAGVGESDHRSP
ncbi:MAG: hypothetical protein Ct9H300mP12_05140 [Acidimicrobiales bacterium]|nr:MAG: hypothetical protein Ct9H300mP12_05140 [Acidimicrobiales bacterium]